MADEPVAVDAGPQVYTTPATYEVSVLPPDWDGPDSRSHWTLRVEWRGADRWAVLEGGNFCLGRDGEWDYEMRPSAREDEWLASHRFPLDEALDLARRYAPDVTVNGISAVEVLAWHRERHPEGGCDDG